jgi:hypothetical protein
VRFEFFDSTFSMSELVTHTVLLFMVVIFYAFFSRCVCCSFCGVFAANFCNVLCSNPEDSIELFKAYLASNATATVAQQVEELRNLTTIQALKPADRLTIFFGAVFPESFIAVNTIGTHVEVLKALASSEIQQRQLLAALEWLVGVKYPASNRLVAKALMQLYDADVVEEDAFLSWAADTVKNEYTVHESMIDYDTVEEVRGFAIPFVKWLQEAEEEGEEDDEEGDEDEEA